MIEIVDDEDVVVLDEDSSCSSMAPMTFPKMAPSSCSSMAPMPCSKTAQTSGGDAPTDPGLPIQGGLRPPHQTPIQGPASKGKQNSSNRKRLRSEGDAQTDPGHVGMQRVGGGVVGDGGGRVSGAERVFSGNCRPPRETASGKERVSLGGRQDSGGCSVGDSVEAGAGDKPDKMNLWSAS